MLRGLLLLVSVAWILGFSGGSRFRVMADEPPREPAALTARSLDPAVIEAVRQRWESEIAKLEARDASETDPENAILFIGTSSIRLWQDLAADMAPFPTIQRGYGGAKYSDVAVFAPRLLKPHAYRGLVIFVANDVSGSPHDHTPQQVVGWLRSIVEVSQQHQPEAPIFVIEITPTARRWEVWQETQAVNAALRDVCLEQPGMIFIPTAPYYLDAAKQPRTELFRDDRLHLNRDGYRLWAQLIKRRLRDFVTMPPAVRPAP
jgi:lysophospholipase L1-like esterase